MDEGNLIGENCATNHASNPGGSCFAILGEDMDDIDIDLNQNPQGNTEIVSKHDIELDVEEG